MILPLRRCWKNCSVTSLLGVRISFRYCGNLTVLPSGVMLASSLFGALLRLPGIDRDKPKPDKAYYTLSDFCVK